MFAFHETATGHNHIIKNPSCKDYSTLCEDASDSISNERYYIAIVADGHGAKECFRSGVGSKFAVEVTKQCLKDFAESIIITPKGIIKNETIFITPRPSSEELLCDSKYYRNQEIKRLTDTIIDKWHDKVKNHYKTNSPTEEELKKNKVEDMDIKNLPENKIFHIYGTTLIAGLMLPKSLILIQQGDGRCEVFVESNKELEIRQPIPWDTRCEYNVTTSMCDEDVVDSIRSCFIDLTKEKVIACYLGSDGVEDAYRDTYEDLGDSHGVMGGVHTFYKYLSCEIVDKGEYKFLQDIEEKIFEKKLFDFSKNGLFSRTGSGDDVSVAGIVDIDALSKYVDKFEKDIKIYKLDEEIFWKDDELRGKTRKHGILKQNYLNSEMEYDKAENEYNNFVDAYEKRKRLGKSSNLYEDYELRKRGRALKQKCKDKATQCRKNIELFNEYNETFSKIQEEIDELKQKKSERDYQPIFDKKQKIYYEETQKELDETVEKLDNDIKALDGELEGLEKEIEEERIRAEEEARRRAEEEARRKAEEEARKRAEKEAKRKAEEERKRAEEERKRAEKEAKRKAEEERKRAEEERKRAEKEAKRKAEEERRKTGQTSEDNKVSVFMSTINGLINGAVDNINDAVDNINWAVEKGKRYIIEQGGKYFDKKMGFRPSGEIYTIEQPDQMDSSDQMSFSDGEEQSQFSDSNVIEYETESFSNNTEEDKPDKQENQSDDSNDDLAGKEPLLVDESEPIADEQRDIEESSQLDGSEVIESLTDSSDDIAKADTETPVNDDQVTSANVIPETPVNVDQGTPANDDTDSANVDQETSVNDDQGTPANVVPETPVNDDQVTSANVGPEAPVNDDTETPVNADQVTSANVGPETPVNDDQVTSANVDQGTPVKADTEIPVNADQVTSANVVSETSVNVDQGTPANDDSDSAKETDSKKSETDEATTSEDKEHLKVDSKDLSDDSIIGIEGKDQSSSDPVDNNVTQSPEEEQELADTADPFAHLNNIRPLIEAETDSKESETDEATTSKSEEQPQDDQQQTLIEDFSANSMVKETTQPVESIKDVEESRADEQRDNEAYSSSLLDTSKDIESVIDSSDDTPNDDQGTPANVDSDSAKETDSKESETNETTTSKGGEQPQDDTQNLSDDSISDSAGNNTQPIDEPKENVAQPKQEEKGFADHIDSAGREIQPDKVEISDKLKAKKEVRNEDGSIPIEVKHTQKSNNNGETIRVVNSHYSERRMSKEKYSCSVSRKFKVQLEIYPNSNPEFEEDD